VALATKATLGGFPILASSSITWELTNGIDPYTTTVDMDPASAKSLIDKLGGQAGSLAGKGHTPVTLKFQSGRGSKPESGQDATSGTVEIKHVYVLGIKPGLNPFIVKVILADRRWLWPYLHIGPERYNWRRDVSHKRLEAVDSDSLLNDVVPDVWYAPWSLKDPEGDARSVWKANEILANVLQQLVDFERDFNGTSIGGKIPGGLENVPLENLLLDGPANQQVGRALAYLPQTGVFIDKDGGIQFYSQFNAEELGFYKSLNGTRGEKVAQGHIAWINNQLIRPSKVNVLFTIESELRFDSDGDEEGPSATQAADFSNTDALKRKMRNVLPVPDFESPITKQVSGTWMRVGQAMHEWETGGTAGSPGAKLDRYYKFEFVRRAFCPFLDYWGALLLTGTMDPDVNHAGRVNALLQHYRRTFQIHPKWWSRILSIHARRVALIDSETGSTAPAGVWADCARIASQRTFSRHKAGGGNKFNMPYAINCKSYPAGEDLFNDSAIDFPITKKSIQAECRVSILDSEQGVIGLDYLPDVHGEFSTLLPSMMTNGGAFIEDDGMPSEAGPGADVTDRDRPISYDAIGTAMMTSSGRRVPELLQEHRVAVILTAVPAIWEKSLESSALKSGDAGINVNVGPKDTGTSVVTDCALFRVTIEATHPEVRSAIQRQPGANQLLGAESLGLTEAFGPEVTVRIGPSIEVARVAWADDRFEDIQRLFGVDTTPGAVREADIKDLVLNAAFGSNDKGASLQQIAIATAASVYAEFANHLEGSAAFGLGESISGVHPKGWMDSVAFELSTSGEASIKVDMPAKIEKLPMDLFIGNATKITIAKLARPDK
jgi:hypothetical protein